MISFDVESELIKPGLLAPPLVCVSYQQDGYAPGLVHQTDAYDCARWLLSEETTTANGVYDLAVFAAKWPDLMPLVFEALMEGRIHCVQNRQKLIDIGLGIYRNVYRKGPNGKLRNLRYSLNDLSIRHLGEEMEKDEWRLRYGEFIDTPIHLWPLGAQQYPLQDAVSTLRVHHAQEAECDLNLHDEPAQMRAHWALHLISCWGFNTDNAQVDKLLRQIHVEQVGRKNRLIREGFVRLDGTRNKSAAQRRMLSLAGTDFSGFKLTDKGRKLVRKKERTREEAICGGFFKMDEEACAETNDSALVDYSEYGQFMSLQSKVRALKVNVPIQTRFEVLLETGRTSSSGRKKEGSKETAEGSCALQNPPRAPGFRECFIPGLYMVLISCDYDMAELVSLAQVCYSWFGYSALRDALNAGIDPHLAFAADLMGISYEEAYQRKDEELVDWYRTLSKAFNFGKPGGLGVKSFRDYARGYGIELSEEQSKMYAQAWLVKWPEMKAYFRRIRDILNSNGKWVEREDEDPILKGAIEQHHTKRIRGGCTFPQAANSEFQGLTADAMKAALFEVMRLCYTVPESPLYGCRVPNEIHDEILLEAPIHRAHEAAMELERVMAEVYQRYTPDVKITASAAMMRRWRKKAKPYYVNGRLTPWEESPKFKEAA